MTVAEREFPAIREHFPGLRRQHAGRQVCFFDGPGGTQIAAPALKAMNDYLCDHNANTHWIHPTSVETDAIVARTRELAGTFFNASGSTMVFGANMTTITFAVTNALRRSILRGDEFVLSELDHQANIDPWKRLANECGATVKMVRLIPATGQLDYDDLLRCVNERTRVIAIGAASNAIGTINDIPRVIAAAKSVRAYTYVDAVHYAPHELVDVAVWDADFVVCSAYKFYGPHVGFLYGRTELLEELDPPHLFPKRDSGAERWESGTPNLEGIAGTGAAIEFLASLGQGETVREQLADTYRRAKAKSHRQVSYLLEQLGRYPKLHLFGPKSAEGRTSTISFTLDGWKSKDIAAKLVEHGIFASHGDCFASTVAAKLGTPDGWLRLGCALYTSDEDVDRIASAIGDVARA